MLVYMYIYIYKLNIYMDIYIGKNATFYYEEKTFIKNYTCILIMTIIFFIMIILYDDLA